MPKQMTKEQRAAYQREYRAKRKLEKHNASQGAPILGGMATSLGIPVEEMPAHIRAEGSLGAIAAVQGIRKDKKTIDLATVPGRIDAAFEIVQKGLRIAELETEVEELEARLAHCITAGTKPLFDALRAGPAMKVQGEVPYNERPMTPVPKKGK